MNIPAVIENVVKNDLCIGCGLCVYKCPTKALFIDWDEFGFLVPELTGNCDLNGDCITVCPFNLLPNKEVETENELADIFIKDTTLFDRKVGKYIGVYAGYSKEFRLTSSSGGVATYIFSELMEKRIVDHVIAVKESELQGAHYTYSLISNKQDLKNTSKTRYYPVTLSTVLPRILEMEGRVAIVGVACFIKAIRLAQHHNPELKQKIPFLVGIICGGVKSRFFTEYLASKSGVENENIKKPQYRIKDINSSASDYSFGCVDGSDENEKKLKMREVGDMWGTGLFKANACDFCDDVSTELADISLGDAWIEPYINDGKGTNVIIVRSLMANSIIQDGISQHKLILNELPIEQFIRSQQGNFNHRQNGITARIKFARIFGRKIPRKRFNNEKVAFEFWIVQFFRMKLRKTSLKIWKNGRPNTFDRNISFSQKQLSYATKIYHLIRKTKVTKG